MLNFSLNLNWFVLLSSLHGACSVLNLYNLLLNRSVIFTDLLFFSNVCSSFSQKIFSLSQFLSFSILYHHSGLWCQNLTFRDPNELGWLFWLISISLVGFLFLFLFSLAFLWFWDIRHLLLLLFFLSSLAFLSPLSLFPHICSPRCNLVHFSRSLFVFFRFRTPRRALWSSLWPITLNDNLITVHLTARSFCTSSLLLLLLQLSLLSLPL